MRKIAMMTLIIALMGCNPENSARIDNLEADIDSATEKTNALEASVDGVKQTVGITDDSATDSGAAPQDTMADRLDELEKRVWDSLPVEPRPANALWAWKADGVEIRQQSRRGGPYDMIMNAMEISPETLQVVSPGYAGEAVTEHFVVKGVVPAFELLHEEPELGVNDYAVTLEPIEIDGVSKHRAVPLECVIAGLADDAYFGSRMDCYEDVISVSCDEMGTESCQLKKLHDEYLKELTLDVEHFLGKNFTSAQKSALVKLFDYRERRDSML